MMFSTRPDDSRGNERLFDLGRPKRVSSACLSSEAIGNADRGSICGRSVQTSDTEIIEVRLREIDKKNASCSWIAWSRLDSYSNRFVYDLRRDIDSAISRSARPRTLPADELTFLLDQSKPFQEIQRHPLKKLATLRGRPWRWRSSKTPRARASASHRSFRLGGHDELQANLKPEEGESLLDTFTR